MKVYLVWDNDDYGSTFFPSQDEIDSVWTNRTKAEWRAAGLNQAKKKWQTRARVQEMEARE